MSSFERTVAFESYQDYLAEAAEADRAKLQRAETVYQDVVEEWRAFHSSPESFHMGTAGMLAILKDTVTEQGVPVQEAYGLCVNAEMDARFNTP